MLTQSKIKNKSYEIKHSIHPTLLTCKYYNNELYNTKGIEKRYKYLFQINITVETIHLILIITCKEKTNIILWHEKQVCKIYIFRQKLYKTILDLRMSTVTLVVDTVAVMWITMCWTVRVIVTIYSTSELKLNV